MTLKISKKIQYLLQQLKQEQGNINIINLILEKQNNHYITNILFNKNNKKYGVAVYF